MKVTKTSVHRLTIEKGCGCKATREFEDVRYTKPIAEGVFIACDKHEKSKAVAEVIGEILIESLESAAVDAGKTVVASRESTPTSLSGTSGESVQSMGAPTMPKTREKRDPLATKNAKFDRPDARVPQNPYGNLNVASHDDLSDEEMVQEGITITGDIDSVPEDPNVDAALTRGLQSMEDIFDAEDVKSGGVSTTLIERQAVD